MDDCPLTSGPPQIFAPASPVAWVQGAPPPAEPEEPAGAPEAQDAPHQAEPQAPADVPEVAPPSPEVFDWPAKKAAAQVTAEWAARGAEAGTDRAPPPKPGEPAARLVRCRTDSAAMQGRRPKQEDRHVKIPDLTKAAAALKMPIGHLEQPCAFFAVYDGHQGHLCAEFAARTCHLRLLKKLSSGPRGAPWTDERVCRAFREALEELDAEFLAKYRTSPDGCTVVATLVTGARMFVAWAGDSRCLLCRSTSNGGIATVALTRDHKPSEESEAARVRAAGGAIVNFDGALRVAHKGFEERVREIRRAQAQGLGTIGKEPVALAVSRSLGDRDFKAVTGKSLLVATPSVRSVRLDESHKFVALMCDGISDVMTDEQVVFELDFVRDTSDSVANVRATCGALVQEAYKRGSQDNLTVVLVQFEWAGETAAPGGGGDLTTEQLNDAFKRRRLAR